MDALSLLHLEEPLFRVFTLSEPYLFKVWVNLSRPSRVGAPGVSRKVRKKAHKASPISSPSRFLVFLLFPSALPCIPAVFFGGGGEVSDSQAICQKLPQAGSILWPVPAQEGASLDGARSKPLGLTHLPLTLNPASTLAPTPSPY